MSHFQPSYTSSESIPNQHNLELPRYLSGESKPFTPENPIEAHAQSAANWPGRAPGIWAGGHTWWGSHVQAQQPTRVWAYGMQRWGPQPFRLEVGGMTNKLNPYGECNEDGTAALSDADSGSSRIDRFGRSRLSLWGVQDAPLTSERLVSRDMDLEGIE